MNSRPALINTILITIATKAAAIMLTDFSFAHKEQRNYSVGAIAVRDNVPAYQKAATKLFTIPYLKRLYDSFVYLEEKDKRVQEHLFISGLQQLLVAHDSVDVYLLAHGNRMVDWVALVDSQLRKKIRLVYNCGCDNARQYEQWKQLGVKYYVGHRGERSLSPLFFYFFIRKRAAGRSLEKSIAAGNRHTRLVLGCIGFSRSKANESCATFYPF